MKSKPVSRPRRAPPRADAARPLATIAVIAGVIGVLVAVTAGVAWVSPHSMYASARPAPLWVTPGEVRATTRDGTLVKLRVSFDARDASTRSALESRLQQVNLLLEVSIGALSHRELIGAQGIVRVAREVLERLNAYLASEGLAPLKSVAIQDLWYTHR